MKQIKSKINKGKCKEKWRDTKRSCMVKVYEERFKMDGVTGTLRFVKFSKKTPEGKYSQVLVITTDFDIPLQTLYKIMHKRWDKENSTFIKLNNGCFVGNGVVIPFLHYRLRID